jgi:hypothetical protein
VSTPEDRSKRTGRARVPARREHVLTRRRIQAKRWLNLCSSDNGSRGRDPSLHGLTIASFIDAGPASNYPCDPKISSAAIPRSSYTRKIVSSIRLFGQEAPAVIPMTAGPVGNQSSVVVSDFW